jgi:hypothetical protein
LASQNHTSSPVSLWIVYAGERVASALLADVTRDAGRGAPDSVVVRRRGVVGVVSARG